MWAQHFDHKILISNFKLGVSAAFYRMELINWTILSLSGSPVGFENWYGTHDLVIDWSSFATRVQPEIIW